MLITQQPVIYLPSTVIVQQPPICLYVPTVHQAQWGRYCGRYRACGSPVYFVREDWLREQYGREREERKRKGGPKHKDRDCHDQGKHDD